MRLGVLPIAAAFIVTLSAGGLPVQVVSPQNGLPVSGSGEQTLYQRGDYGADYRAFLPGEASTEQYYIAWKNDRRRYVWVSGKDRQPIRSGSMAKGWKFGFTHRLDYNDWYLLVNNRISEPVEADWVRMPGQPCVYLDRWEDRYRDCAANGWASLGILGCRLSLSATRIPLGEALKVTWEVTGPADRFLLDGSEKALADTEGVRLVPTAVGRYQIEGKAVQSNGFFNPSCYAEYEVIAPAPPPSPPKKFPPSCAITAEPASVPLGSPVLFSIEPQGRVEQVFLDQQSLEPRVLKRIRIASQIGQQAALAQVRGPDGEGTCWVRYEVTAGH